MGNKIISIVIRVRNAARDLERCLGGITQQMVPTGYKLETAVVDNESVDGSAEVARKYGASVIFLAAEDFSWGRALNRGIYKTSGEIVLILSADACPADRHWISEMLKPFEDPNIVAVYGRQIPRADAPIDEIVRLKKTFGETTRTAKAILCGYSPRGGDFPVSNACAAIRRSMWEKMAYDELISGGEEGVWTYEVLSQGYGIVYQASACVYHSHNDSVFRSCWRHLELVKKNTELAGKKASVLTYLHFILGKIKRRAKNCLFPGLGWGVRFKGLLILPYEVCLFLITAWFFHNGKKTMKYRSFFWDN